MSIDRPVVTAAELDRVVLLVDKPLSELKGTLVVHYLRFGEQAEFASAKSAAGPVPKRRTCAARDPWYDLTKLVKPGFALWPKATQYRHVAVYNPGRVVSNCRLYDIGEKNGVALEPESLTAILNSTLVALWRHFYGRYTGNEGSLDTMTIDFALLEVPDPRFATDALSARLTHAFRALSQRSLGRMVEEQLMDCHSPQKAAAIAAGQIVLPEELRRHDRHELDDAVFELLGVSDPAHRRDLVDRLYGATAAHFREIRVVEIQKMEQRAKSRSRRFSSEELASDAWDAVYYKDGPSIADWIANRPADKIPITIPLEGAPRLVDASAMFDREIVFFGKDRHAQRVVCSCRGQAELVARLAELGFRGKVSVCGTEESCRKTMAELEAQLQAAVREFETIASERVADDRKRAEIVALLMRWRIHGKPRSGARDAAEDRIGEETSH